MTRHGQSRGFTLIESLATVAVLSALGSVASLLIVQAIDDYTDAANAADLHLELSMAMDRVVRDIRRIPLDPAAAGTAPDITSMTTGSLTWRDADGDAGRLNLSGTDLRLQLDGGASEPILQNVTSFSVSAYDQDGTDLGAPLAAARCDPIRRIRLEVTVQRSGVTERLRANVFLRSTMSGGG